MAFPSGVGFDPPILVCWGHGDSLVRDFRRLVLPVGAGGLRDPPHGAPLADCHARLDLRLHRDSGRLRLLLHPLRSAAAAAPAAALRRPAPVPARPVTGPPVASGAP